MPEPTFETILIAEVLIPDGRRKLDEGTVVKLMESFETLGQQTPIAVLWDAEENTRLVAGGHRLEAARRLGWKEVGCTYFKVGEEAKAKLWEISENLHRKDLTPLERNGYIADWIRITEEEAVKVQSSQSGTIEESKRADKRGHRKESGVAAASRKLGIPKNEAHRALKTDAITSKAKKAFVEAGLTTQADLMKVATAPDEKAQLAEIAKIVKVKAEPALKYKEQIDPVLWEKLAVWEGGKHLKAITVLKSIATVKQPDQALVAHNLTGLPFELSEAQWNAALAEVWVQGKPAWQKKFIGKQAARIAEATPKPKTEKPAAPPPKAEKSARKPKVAKAA